MHGPLAVQQGKKALGEPRKPTDFRDLQVRGFTRLR
jgi:hypothetical protein